MAVICLILVITDHSEVMLVPISQRVEDGYMNPTSKMIAQYSKSYTITARCCANIISVTPLINDLGECSVGDYKAAVFTIQNESDLPAIVCPFVGMNHSILFKVFVFITNFIIYTVRRE